jgi:hypothetical protein
MSWATCYSGSNNIHYSSPPLMSDGRNYASWTPDATMNDQIKRNAKIASNWDYRRYLQHNAQDIMKYNNREACYTLGLNPQTVTNTQPSLNVPFVFQSVTDERHPPYGYRNSDLKNLYLSSEKLNARMIAPSIPTNTFSEKN